MVASRLRKAGYRAALAEAGVPFDPALLEPCDLSGHAGESQLLYDAIDRMLRLSDPPTVLCCGNDKMALMVYGILRSRGIKVPNEMSVAGYDNYRVIAETLYPPLTTVDLSYTAMGVRAAQRLMALISGLGRDDRSALIVPGPVHWRASVTERAASNVSQLKAVREV